MNGYRDLHIPYSNHISIIALTHLWQNAFAKRNIEWGISGSPSVGAAPLAVPQLGFISHNFLSLTDGFPSQGCDIIPASGKYFLRLRCIESSFGREFPQGSLPARVKGDFQFIGNWNATEMLVGEEMKQLVVQMHLIATISRNTTTSTSSVSALWSRWDHKKRYNKKSLLGCFFSKKQKVLSKKKMDIWWKWQIDVKSCPNFITNSISLQHCLHLLQKLKQNICNSFFAQHYPE